MQCSGGCEADDDAEAEAEVDTRKSRSRRGYQWEAKYRNMWCRFRQVILDMYLRTLAVALDGNRNRLPSQPTARIKVQERVWIPAGLCGVQGPCRAPRVEPREGDAPHSTPPGACKSTGWLASPKRHLHLLACLWPDGRSLEHRAKAALSGKGESPLHVRVCLPDHHSGLARQPRLRHNAALPDAI